MDQVRSEERSIFMQQCYIVAPILWMKFEKKSGL